MKKFFDDIKSELGKISWINKRENIKSTGGVVLVTIILGVFLLIVDFVFSSRDMNSNSLSAGQLPKLQFLVSGLISGSTNPALILKDYLI